MKPSVVYVDDAEFNLNSVEMILEESWEFKGFQDPEKALAELPNIMPMVVLSDYRMPDMKGIEFLEKVSEICPNARRILITGYSSEELVLEAVKVAKVHDYIRKPCTNEEILETLNRSSAAYRNAKGAK